MGEERGIEGKGKKVEKSTVGKRDEKKEDSGEEKDKKKREGRRRRRRVQRRGTKGMEGVGMEGEVRV